MQRKVSSIQQFNYKKGNMNLDFSVDTEKKTDLKDFRECLMEGIGDIDKILKKINEKQH